MFSLLVYESHHTLFSGTYQFQRARRSLHCYRYWKFDWSTRNGSRETTDLTLKSQAQCILVLKSICYSKKKKKKQWSCPNFPSQKLMYKAHGTKYICEKLQ